MDTDVECFSNTEGSLAGQDLVANCENGEGERDQIGEGERDQIGVRGGREGQGWVGVTPCISKSCEAPRSTLMTT